MRYSITAKLYPGLKKVIEAIDESAWTPIAYFLDGADVAETTYQPFGKKGRPTRLIVRRVRPTPGSQLALFTEFSYRGASAPTRHGSASTSLLTTWPALAAVSGSTAKRSRRRPFAAVT